MTNSESEQAILHWPMQTSSNIYRSTQDREQLFHFTPKEQPLENLSTDEKLKLSDIILTGILTSSSSDSILSQKNIPSLMSKKNLIQSTTATRKRKYPIENSQLFLTPAIPAKRSNTITMFFPNLNSSNDLFVMSFDNSKSIQTDSISWFSNLANTTRQYDRTIEELKLEIHNLHRNQVDLQNQHDTTVETIKRCLNMTRSLLIEKSQLEKKQVREKAMENRLRLGQFITQRQGLSFVEQWVDGFEFVDKQRAKEQIIRTKENLDKERKILAKKKNFFQLIDETNTNSKRMNKKFLLSPQRPDSSNDGHNLFSIEYHDSDSSSSSSSSILTYKDWYQYDEVLRLRQLTLKRDEYDLAQDCERLDRERNLHIRELKRLYNEDQSRFNKNTILNERYLLLSLIGKGGFSEVHRAFDLHEQQYVACKIHQLNNEWKEEKKANFIKHALREYDIHKHLEHKRIVKLFDVFEIDTNSFCTVLEYCDGNDLDLFLKENKTLPEKEARSIIMQIINALKYLNKDVKPPVIHYDLKPGNVLLGTGNNSGEIKITDFGLSKQMHEDIFDEDDGMDLSSQGAGTYWYLPPEVFVQGPNPPKISSKVDVWSVGCIFYQCLYGRKPYGHNLSQAAVLENKIILNAKEIEFPSRPQISNEAKNFIRRCLTYQARDRPDVLQISEDEYFKSSSKRSTAISSSTLFCPK